MRPIHDPILASIPPGRRPAPLHLVSSRGAGVPPASPFPSSSNRTASPRDVARENRSAALTAQALTNDDARLIFTRAAASAIEGGRAALIRPETRKQLLTTARRLGIRPFDAHLSIAIAQDRARRGEPLAITDSFTHPTLARRREHEHVWHIARLVTGAAALAGLLLVLLVRWIDGAQ